MPNPANTQKLERAYKDDDAPSQNAIALVTEVIVIDAPACFMPSFILFSTERDGSVWSIAADITNISSTPIPISKNGSS